MLEPGSYQEAKGSRTKRLFQIDEDSMFFHRSSVLCSGSSVKVDGGRMEWILCELPLGDSVEMLLMDGAIVAASLGKEKVIGDPGLVSLMLDIGDYVEDNW